MRYIICWLTGHSDTNFEITRFLTWVRCDQCDRIHIHMRDKRWKFYL